MARSGQTAGVALVVIGIIVLIFGAVMLNTGTTQANLLRTNNYVILAGDNLSVSVNLNSGQKMTGTYTQTNGSSVNFYLMTAAQQDFFGNCVPCAAPALANVSNPNSFNFAWTVNTTGTYFLVMDNSNGGNNVGISLTATTATSSGMNPTYELVLIVGIVIAVIGAIITVSSRESKSKRTREVENQKAEAAK
ncbi:MAG: hypothetical protein ACRECH_11140 [Nitrososphaerales archaeon]